MIKQGMRDGCDRTKDTSSRASEIDAIRGWASLSVATFHIMWEALGLIVPSLKNPYTSGLISGRFDVILFFILSGDALSYPFFHGGGVSYLQRAALKRYLRLTIPIAAATAAIALAMSSGLTFNKEAAVRLNSLWLANFAGFDPTLTGAIKFSLSQVYFGGGQPYLPFLWTMLTEFTGSYMLFLALIVSRALRQANTALFAAAVLLIATDSYVGCFFLGAVLGSARKSGFFASVPPLIGATVAPAGMITALFLAGHLQMIPDFSLPMHAFAGFTFLSCAYCCNPLLEFLRKNHLSALLGRISYLLYLWHYVVIVTFMSWIVVQLSDHDLLSQPVAVIVGLITLGLSIGLSWITLPIETHTQKANSALLRLILRRDAIAAAEGQAAHRS